jgi:membrane-associated phospholipid phosphatase
MLWGGIYRPAPARIPDAPNWMNSLSHGRSGQVNSPARSSIFLPERFFFEACLVLLTGAFYLARSGYDTELLSAIYGGSGARSAGFWRLISSLGSNWSLIPIVAAFGLLEWRKKQDAALWLVCGWGMTTGTVELLQWLVARPRPLVPFLVSASGSSFPSGHAAESLFVFYYLGTILAGSWRREHRTLSAGWSEFCAILLFALPPIIGYSRVYLGVHWPSDILGGWAIGLFILGIALLNTPCCRNDPTGSKTG